MSNQQAHSHLRTNVERVLRQELADTESLATRLHDIPKLSDSDRGKEALDDVHNSIVRLDGGMHLIHESLAALSKRENTDAMTLLRREVIAMDKLREELKALRSLLESQWKAQDTQIQGAYNILITIVKRMKEEMYTTNKGLGG